MVKSVNLKRFLKSTIFRAVSEINKFIPKNDKIILLYSANKGIQHSLIPLKTYLLNNNYEKKYTIICGIENMRYAENDQLVTYVPRVKAFIIFMKARHIFYTTGQIPIKPSKSQCVIHMRHGNANFKTVGKRTHIGNGDEFFFNYVLASSELFVNVTCEEYGCQPKNVAVIGDPLIDQLLDAPQDAYDFSAYKKVVLWLPTFRQSDDLGYDDSSMKSVMPLFEETDYEEMEKVLKGLQIKLIVKLHPAQNNFDKSKKYYKYFDIYSNDDFVKEGYELYSLMAQSDALIGDYSSASMQYLVLNRPQAYVIPDIEEYSQKRGFVFDDPEEYMAGHIIRSKKDFYQFLADLANGEDKYADRRNCICKKIYKYIDDRNCERILKLSNINL